ncbi:hypothetical protein DRO35_04905 [Candidatus Bathyarchaeota archaeon]|nr:MAG: hypothetical protein DRO35_04905 [Candidatus Bathyarchaeota archaeon]
MSKHVGVRMRPEDVKLLRNICRARGEDLSDFVRRAVRKELARLSFLTIEEKKALGIDVDESATNRRSQI